MVEVIKFGPDDNLFEFLKQNELNWEKITLNDQKVLADGKPHYFWRFNPSEEYSVFGITYDNKIDEDDIASMEEGTEEYDEKKAEIETLKSRNYLGQVFATTFSIFEEDWLEYVWVASMVPITEKDFEEARNNNWELTKNLTCKIVSWIMERGNEIGELENQEFHSFIRNIAEQGDIAGYQIKCIACGIVYTIPAAVEDVERYQHGELIQDALPYLSPGKREMFNTQICEKCWDEHIK